MRTRSSSPRQPSTEGGAPKPGRRRPRGLIVAAGAAAIAAVAAAGVTAAAFASGGAAGPGAGAARSAVTSDGKSAAGRAATHAPASRSGAGSPAAARSKAMAGPKAGPRRGAVTGAGQAKNAGSRPKALRTSCRSVAHIGDSTSVDLVSPDYLPVAGQRLGARYAAVGVRHLKVDASGGRSIVEEMPGQINGYKVASAWQGQGYHGCWVFALGTNDTANVAAGSTVTMMARIDQMMAAAHGQPVMWVNTRTQLTTGPWASGNEQAWDKTLVRALAKYPNMRIFNWSAVAQPAWFLSDGIHYNSLGCAMRAKAIADALARAFPQNGHSAGKVVR
jgi:hypothetical protein